MLFHQRGHKTDAVRNRRTDPISKQQNQCHRIINGFYRNEGGYDLDKVNNSLDLRAPVTLDEAANLQKFKKNHCTSTAEQATFKYHSKSQYNFAFIP